MSEWLQQCFSIKLTNGSSLLDSHNIALIPIVLLLLSHSVMSNSLRPHWLQHARLPCPSPSPGVYSNSCSLSLWCHPTISSSVAPLLFFSPGMNQHCVRTTRHPHSAHQHCYAGGRREAILLGRRGCIFASFHHWLLPWLNLFYSVKPYYRRELGDT